MVINKKTGMILDPKTGTMVSPNLGKALMMKESGVMMSSMDSKNGMTMNPVKQK